MRTAILVLTFMPLVYAQSGNAPRPHAIGDWQKMIPAIRETLKAQFPDERGDGPYPVGILRAGHVADITGDGLSEAVVFFGQGGASTSQLTLMRVEGGKPVVALFKDPGRKGTPHDFHRGYFGNAHRWGRTTCRNNAPYSPSTTTRPQRKASSMRRRGIHVEPSIQNVQSQFATDQSTHEKYLQSGSQRAR